MAGERQVKGVYNKYALQHNIGLGGACVVAIYKRFKPSDKGWIRQAQTSDPNLLEKYEAKKPKF